MAWGTCLVGGLSLGVRMVRGHVVLRDASRREFFLVCPLVERYADFAHSYFNVHEELLTTPIR